VSQSLALRLYLFGDFRLERDRQPTHKAEAHSRERLAALPQ
jgi:hypothetical protein